MLGLEALRSGSGDSMAYRRPNALLPEGQALAPHVTAMMDVSDGLLLDATRMARASGLTFVIDSAAVPIAAPEDRRAEALRWGDDYQLLYTLPAGATPPIPSHRIASACPAGPAPVILDGSPLTEHDGLGYEHG
jgi:thiamine-monophosphate kinase